MQPRGRIEHCPADIPCTVSSPRLKSTTTQYHATLLNIQILTGKVHRGRSSGRNLQGIATQPPKECGQNSRSVASSTRAPAAATAAGAAIAHNAATATAAHVSLCRRTMAPENTTSSDATSVNANMMGSTLLSYGPSSFNLQQQQHMHTADSAEHLQTWLCSQCMLSKSGKIPWHSCWHVCDSLGGGCIQYQQVLLPSQEHGMASQPRPTGMLCSLRSCLLLTATCLLCS